MLDITLSPKERAQAGETLAKLGDPRHGVSVDGAQISDIAWCIVPGNGPSPLLFTTGIDII